MSSQSKGSFFYSDLGTEDLELITQLENYAIKNSKSIYVIDKPLGYDFNSNLERSEIKSIVILSPKHKICIVNIDFSPKEKSSLKILLKI